MTISSNRRRFLQGSAAAVGGAAVLAACGQQSAEDQAAQEQEDNQEAVDEQLALPSTAWERAEYDEVEDGGQLRLAVLQMPDNWNSDQTDGNLADLSTIRYPMGYDRVLMANETGEIDFNPDYIESAELTSEDPQIVEVKFNSDAVWENGDPIVVDDLIAQWNALKGEDEDYQIVSSEGWAQISEIRQTDDEYSCEVEFSEPFVDWQTRVFPSAPASVYEDAENFNTGYVDEPTPSCGPFKIANIDSTGGQVTLERNDQWWGRAPKLETIIFSVVDQNTQPSSFANGELDALDIGTGDVLSQAEGRSDATIQRSNGLTWTHLTMNTQGANGVLEDVAVREAIAKGIDRDAIGRAVVGPMDAPVVLVDNYVYMPGQEGYEPSFDGGPIEHDPEAAGQLLDEAGWEMGDGDVREKDGEQLSMRIIVPADTKSNSDRADQVVQDLSALGFDISTQSVPSDAYFDEYVVPKNYDMVTFSWVGSLYPEMSSANLFYPADSAQNFTNYADDEVGEINRRLQSTFDEDERRTVANELSAKIAESYAVIPFYATPIIFGVTEGLVNYGASQFETADWTAVGYRA